MRIGIIAAALVVLALWPGCDSDAEQRAQAQVECGYMPDYSCDDFSSYSECRDGKGRTVAFEGLEAGGQVTTYECAGPDDCEVAACDMCSWCWFETLGVCC